MEMEMEMGMESYSKAMHTKRFVVEDSITKVTSDGQPHEMMTIIAGLSGLAAAIVILAILVSLIVCKKGGQSAQPCKNCPGSPHLSSERSNSFPTTNSQRSSLSTIYTRGFSIPDDNLDSSLAKRPALISMISTGSLEGNINSAFVGSELCLNDGLQKPKNKIKKKTHWSDEIQEPNMTPKESTTIDIV